MGGLVHEGRVSEQNLRLRDGRDDWQAQEAGEEAQLKQCTVDSFGKIKPWHQSNSQFELENENFRRRKKCLYKH